MPTATDDQQHLRLLSIFHYVVGGLAMLFACFPLIHFGLGLMMVFWPDAFGTKPGETPPPQFIGWFFTCLGGAMFLMGQAVAVCILLCGRFIKRRRRYWFVFIMACIECAFVPFGTVLGVFTIITLSRESVKELFGLVSPGISAA